MSLVSRNDDSYLNKLEDLSIDLSFATSISEKNTLEERITTLLNNHSDDLIADLVIHPKDRKRYRNIGSNLRENSSLKKYQYSLGYIQRIAKCLENHDEEGLKKLSAQMSHLIPDLKASSLLLKLSELKLPRDIQEICQISQPNIRALVFAHLINRDKMALSDLMDNSLNDLKLTKNEIFQLSPYLTYLDFGNITFKSIEINKILQSCSFNLTCLKIGNEVRITELPPLPLCQNLDCSNCKALTKLPDLPLCTVLKCKGCSALTELPAMPLCQELSCGNCTALTELPALPVCQSLFCEHCPALIELPDLPLCQTLSCSRCSALTELPDLPLCQKLDCFLCSALTELPDLPLCQSLTCYSCTALTELPDLPLCQSLTCYSCTALTELPDLPSCQKLNCYGCSLLTELPDLPLCQTLYCSSCSALTELPAMPLCQELSCGNCTALSELPDLPLCQTLSCFSCSALTELPDLPLCQTLSCFSCSALTELPALPLCQELFCGICTALTELPALPLCQKLVCYGCSLLTELPDLPLCQTLSCFICSALTELPALPLCQKLVCYGCSLLTELPDLPLCQELFCADCTALTELPALPLCQTLSCQRCISLRTIPALPLCSTLHYENCPNLDLNTVPERLRARIQTRTSPLTIQIRVEDLNEDPLKVLLDLEDTVLKRRVLPKIQFVEAGGRITEAADAGGVSRVFISRLMKSLITHCKEPKQLSFKEMKSGLYVPVFDNHKDLNVQIKGFQIIGALFDQCIGGPGLLPVSTGILFDRELFKMLLAPSYDDLASLDVEQINQDLSNIPNILKIKLMAQSPDKSYSNTAKLLLIDPEKLTPAQFETLKEIVISGIDEDEKLPIDLHKENPSNIEKEEIISFVRSFVQKSLFESVQQDSYIPAILIAKQIQLRKGTKAEYEALQKAGVVSLETKIQGILDPVSVVKALNFSVGDRQLDKARVEKTVDFIKLWIYEASPQDLMNFNSFITGSPTLRDNTTLHCNFYDTKADHLPTSHSCFNTLDLSVNYPEYKDFKANLETAIASVNNLETSGLEAV